MAPGCPLQYPPPAGRFQGRGAARVPGAGPRP